MCKKITNYKNTRNYKNFANWLVYSFQSFTKINSPQMSELRRWDSQCDLLYFWIASSEYDIKWSCSDGDLYLTGSLPLCPLSPLCSAILAVLTTLFAAATLLLCLAPIMQVSLLLSNINHMDQATYSTHVITSLDLHFILDCLFFVKSFMQVLFYKYSVFFIFFPLKMPRHHSQSRRK